MTVSAKQLTIAAPNLPCYVTNYCCPYSATKPTIAALTLPCYIADYCCPNSAT